MISVSKSAQVTGVFAALAAAGFDLANKDFTFRSAFAMFAAVYGLKAMENIAEAGKSAKLIGKSRFTGLKIRHIQDTVSRSVMAFGDAAFGTGVALSATEGKAVIPVLVGGIILRYVAPRLVGEMVARGVWNGYLSKNRQRS